MIAACLLLPLLPTHPDDGTYDDDDDGGDDDGGGGGGGKGAHNPGGVEFKNINPIIGINSPELFLSKTNNIFFTTKSEEDIKAAFNMLVLPEFRGRSIREYFDTIMQEVAVSIYSQKDLPFVSLHFNDSGLLYSVMSPFYRTTLIGNVLTFIDYFMKGFVNGGFFSIDFVRTWAETPPNDRIIDPNILNAHLINVKKSLQNGDKKTIYYPLNEIIDQDQTAQEFYSAFRIIGQMEGIGKADDILFPIEGFTVEHDLDTKPEMQRKIDSGDGEIKEYYDKISTAYHVMKEIIKIAMPEVPEFSGFFPILDMITFAFHYTLSLQSIGKAVNTSNAFQNTGQNVKYVPPIPDVFPPLPVADKRQVKIEIMITDVIESIQNTSFNDEITDILNSEQEEFSRKCLTEIKKEIKIFYRQKMFELLGEEYDDNTIRLNNFTESIIEFIKNIPTLIKNDLYGLISHIEDFIKDKIPDFEETPSTLTFIELVIKSKDRYEQLSELYNLNSNVAEDPNDHLKQYLLEQMRNYEAHLISQNQSNEDSLKQVRNAILLLSNNITIRLAINNYLELLKQDINNFSKTIESFMSTYKETLKKYSFGKQFYIVTPKIQDQGVNNKIIGGCNINLSQRASIQIAPISDKELMEINTIVKDKNIKDGFIHCSNGMSGLVMKLEIIPLPIDGTSLKYSPLLNIIMENEEKGIESPQKVEFKTICDNWIETQHQNETNGKPTPAYEACCSGDITMISFLIQNGADFGQVYANGISPFLACIMGGHHDAVYLLLTDPNAKIGDINRATESKITPLYYAIYYNFPDIVDLLLKKGAIPTIAIKSNGMSSVHIACYLDRLECLIILAQSATDNNIFIQSTGGVTPLQVALSHSPRCAAFLINQKKDINFDALDPRNYTTHDIAMLNGNYELAKILPDEGKMSDILKYDYVKSNENSFESLCRFFSSGDVLSTGKSLKKYLSLSDQKLTNKLKEKLVSSACTGGCIEYIEMLSRLFSLEEYPIALSAAQYGLVDWISEIEKYGGKLMCEVNNRTIFDEAVINSDNKFLEKAFDVVGIVPRKILKRILRMSIENNNIKTIVVISTALTKLNQFIDPSDILLPNLSRTALKIFKNNFDTNKKVDLANLVIIVSPNLTSYALALFNFSKDEVKNACLNAINNKRFDNAYTILQQNSEVARELNGNNRYPIIRQLTDENKNTVINIVKELIDDETIPENDKIMQLKECFQNAFDIGELPFENRSSLIKEAGKNMKNLWILKVLPIESLDRFSLSIDAFETDQMYLLFQKVLQIFEKMLGKKKAGEYFLNSIKELDFQLIEKSGKANEFISSFLKSLKGSYLLAKDKSNQTIFHFISKFNSINDENMNLSLSLMNKYESMRKSSIFDARSRKGDTILMNLAKAGNINAIEYIVMNKEISFLNRDIYGNNILHKILKGRYATNDRIIYCISLIVKKCPELILQRNRNGKNPFMIAAQKGFIGILGLMSTIYPIKVLDSSLDQSVIHLAAKKNHRETIHYIVQVLHIDVNSQSKDGFTPIQFAAMKSCVLSYQELLSLGANPLIKNPIYKMNAIDFAMKYGAEKMIKFVMETPSFSYALSSTDILFHLASNKEGYKGFLQVMKFYQETVINSSGPEGKNIVSIACIKNNRKIVADSLMLGCDPEKVDEDGQNAIHICAKYNSIGCSDLILNHINGYKGSNGITTILNASDSDGNLPIHIASSTGYGGFVAHLLCACKEQNFNNENNSGFTPFALSILNGHKKVAGIFVFWMELLNKPLDLLISKLNPTLKKKWEDEFVSSDDYNYSKQIVAKIKENLWQPIPPKKYSIEKTNDYLSNTDILFKILKKYKIGIDDKYKDDWSTVFVNSIFQSTISFLLNDENNVNIVKKVIKSIITMKSKKICEIAYLILFPIIFNEDIDQFTNLISQIDQLKIDESNPLFSWVENGLITIAETNINRKEINDHIKSILELISYISKKKSLKDSISYPVLPAPIHEISSFILSIKDENYKEIQIRFANLIKASSLWNNSSSLSIEFCNRIDEGQFTLLNYVIDQFNQPDIIEKAILLTLDLYEYQYLSDEEREIILIQCISTISNEDDPKLLKNEINSWFTYSIRVIESFGISYYKDILQSIPQSSLSIANEALFAILEIGSPEIANKVLIEKGIDSLKKCALRIQKDKIHETRNLSDIIRAFGEGSGNFIPYKFAFDGRPVFKLKRSEIASLESFGQLLEKQIKIATNLSVAAQERGKAFRDKPTIENAAKLVAIVRQAIHETYDINPFMVQCLTVFSMLLHRIDKNDRLDLKGRIAQVATGEGKSIIIAMLAGCIALTGSCVDIISSSIYLAKRDAEKFKPFYEKLGLRCGSFKENDFSLGFDFHILYSTNVGFEFALLHEGLNGEINIKTTLLYENVKKQRPRMTAIVDEADNLFIDTAMNPAQYSVGGNNKKSWIYKTIWKSVCSIALDPRVIRQKLLNDATNREQLNDVNGISDDQLKRIINNALLAIKLEKNVNYVIGKNKLTNEKEIQIIDADNTGRIRYGSRWSNGLHEFVELKEGLPIREQTYTVASISHPSYFEPYEEIFGLTGTLGEVTERDEILQIYHVDSFDVPPNRKCLRKRDKTLILSTAAKKEEIIIDTIRKMKRKGRPILVLVYSIKESQKLSDILRIKRIDHLLLNDLQKQDEDFIIDRAGRPGAVTIATNTAGRGTDIHISDDALSNGGLHTLITFWPANIRVECQALGRSARQGQPGSCQIIFESNEFGNDETDPTEETLRNVYEKRSNEIKMRTAFRIDLIKKEKLIFSILNQYFEYIFRLKSFFESSSISLDDCEEANISIIINDLSSCWSQFYSTLLIDKNPKEDSFETFLNQWSFDKRFPRLSKKFNDYISNLGNDMHSPIWSPTVSIDDNFSSSGNNGSLLDDLMAMGFDEELCRAALNRSENNINVAIELLLNGRQQQIDSNENPEQTQNELMNELLLMGFDQESCEQALRLSNNNIEIATTLLLNGQLNRSNRTNNNSEFDNNLLCLTMMGFDEEISREALMNNNNDLNKAIDFLSNQRQIDPEIEQMIDELVSMGFDRNECITALSNTGNHFDEALELLLNR